MFSGIVETIATLLKIKLKEGCKYFTISPLIPLNDIVLGESIAVNGVCLTVTAISINAFEVAVVPETLRRTTLDQLIEGSILNLERSVKADGRMSGHYVQGHVDGIAEILDLKKDNSNALLASIRVPASLSKYIVDKGYVALDGMSITVIKTIEHHFTVTFIPHTQAVTRIKHYRPGDNINIEVDIVGKYIEKLLGAHTCKHVLNE